MLLSRKGLRYFAVSTLLIYFSLIFVFFHRRFGDVDAVVGPSVIDSVDDFGGSSSSASATSFSPLFDGYEISSSRFEKQELLSALCARADDGIRRIGVADPLSGFTDVFLSSYDVSDNSEKLYGYEYYLEWISKSESLCAVNVSSSGSRPSSLACATHNHPKTPPATHPHTICTGEQILLQPKHFVPTAKLRFRPNFSPKTEGKPYWNTSPGSLVGIECSNSPAFSIEKFSKDMIRDLFNGWRDSTFGDVEEPGQVVDEPVLLVLRENGEYRNVFHAMTDFVNAFATLFVFSTRLGVDFSSSVRLCLLDGNKEGPLDGAWSTVFSPRGEVIRGAKVYESGEAVLFRRLLFSPPGYSSFLFTSLSEDRFVAQATRFMKDFAGFFLRRHGIDPTPVRSPDRRVLRISVVFRRPWFPAQRIDRQIGNENELIDALSAVSFGSVHTEVTSYDFAKIPMTEQLAIAQRTDVLITVHGAACSHGLFLPPWGALLEIWPVRGQRWRCFENMALWSGHTYLRYNCDAARCGQQVTSTGDTLIVPAREIAAALQQLGQIVIVEKEWWIHPPRSDCPSREFAQKPRPHFAPALS